MGNIRNMEVGNDRVYLLGMPGAGKSTLGRVIAQKLDFQFVDLDEKIEEIEDCSIADIFTQKGEEYFRRVEQDILKKTIPTHTVIATGGGVPCFFDNIDFINTHGYSIFLDVPLSVLAKRIIRQQGKRPLLPQTELDSLVKSLEEKYRVRLPFYQQAHLTINGPNPDPHLVASLIKERLSL